MPIDPLTAQAHSEGHTVHDTGASARKVAAAITKSITDPDEDVVAAPVEPQRAPHELERDHGIQDYGGTAQNKETQEAYKDLEVPDAEKAADSVAEAAEDFVDAAEELGIEVTPELLDELAQLGVELGIDPEAVDPALKPGYSRLVESAVRLGTRVRQAEEQYHALSLERDELANQFENSPEKILIAMATTKPEAFKEAVEIFAKMESSPDYRNMVLRELASEARLAEAARREQVIQFRDRRAAAVRLRAETLKQAAKYGVNAESAEQYIANAIIANQNQPIPLENVEVLLAGLAGQKRKSVRRAPAAVTPQQHVAAQSAPNKAVTGEAPVKGADTLGGGRRGRQSKIRGLIGDALRRSYND